MKRVWTMGILVGFAVALIAPYTLFAFLLTGDVRDTYLPIEDFYRGELRAERLPAWDPNIAMGFPVLASAQTGFWQFPLLLLRPWTSPEQGYAIAYLFHAILLALGTYVYARSLSLSRTGALLTALGFTGSGFMAGHLVHGNIFFSVAWMPYALLCADRLAASLRLRPFLLLSCILALATFPGHFHVAGMMVVLVLTRLFTQLRARYTAVPFTHTMWTFGLFAAPLLVVWVALTAAQLFPTLELIRESTRGMGEGFDIGRANQHSFPPWQLMTFVIPAFFGFPDLSEYWGTRPQIEMTAWIGTIPLLLALIGATGKLQSSNSKFQTSSKDQHLKMGRSAFWMLRMLNVKIVWSLVLGFWNFWTVVAVLSFLLALGRWSPFRLIGIEPTLGIFSSPARYLLFMQFALALLAGRGLDRVAVLPHAAQWVGRLGIGAALAVTSGSALVKLAPDLLRRLGALAVDRFILGAAGHVLSRESYLQKIDYLLERVSTWGVNLGNPLVLLSVVLLAAGGLALQSRRSAIIHDSSLARKSVLISGLVIATAFELIVLAWQVHPRVPWTELSKTSPVVQVLRERPWGRLYAAHPQGDTGLYVANPTTANRNEHEHLLRDLPVANIFTRAGIPSIEWTAALDLARASELLSRLRDAEGRPINENLLDRFSVRYVTGSTNTPDLFLPPPARELFTMQSGENATIRVWERPTARPRVEVLSALPKEITEPLPSSAGTAVIVMETPHRLSIGVRNDTQQETALVVRDTWYPGWDATLDQTPVPLVRAESIFRGVMVPPGTHLVRMTYHPRALQSGMIVSGIAFSGVAFLLLLPLLKRRSV
ncbi:MAG: hypothetical protein G01um1014106_476 [Parcubacteria group bacterium Gr01-1014_106]|nr:MAG: hypothetical protein G01um1014106_476 [Parcubacteria group bacterium Gr01-1014_106]